MKLLMISTDRNIFDEKSAVRARMVEYAKNLQELYIIVFSRRGFEKFEEGNLKVYPTNSLTKFCYIFDAIKIGKKIIGSLSETFTITCQDPFETGIVGVCLKRKFGIPLELQIHTDLFSPFFKKVFFMNRARLFISRFILLKADKIRVVSKRILDSLVEKGIDKTKIYVKPIFVEEQKIVQSLVTIDLKKKYPQFEKIVLVVSRLEKEKNVELAIQSWKEVCEKVSNAGLVIVGSGSRESFLKSLVSKLSLGKSVVFEPWNNEVYSYYKTADVLINTSFYEGYGMTLKEASVVGIPIISTDVGIAREIGANVVGFNKKEISEKIIEILR